MPRHHGSGFTTGLAIQYVLYSFLATIGMTSSLYAAGEVWIPKGADGDSITALAIDPTTPQTIYAGTSSNGVFKSTDGGIHWSAFQASANFAINALAIDPETPRTVYAGTGGDGVYKTTDGGSNWIEVNEGLIPQNVYSLAVDVTTPQIIYVGTNGGVFKSTDGGNTWNAAGLDSQYVIALAVDPDTPQTIYAGTSGLGAYKSTDGGSSWNSVGLNGQSVAALAVDSTATQIIYAGTYFSGVFKSTDGGNSWGSVNTGLTGPRVITLAMDPMDSQTIYAGTFTKGVFKSTDGGDSWNPFDTNLTSFQVNSLAIDPTTPQTIYAGTFGSVFKSSDGGGNWNAVNTGLTKSQVNSIVIDSMTPKTIYAGTTSAGVLKSTNGGRSWIPYNKGLDFYTIKALAMNPSDSQTIYAASGNTVYISTDGAESWSETHPPAVYQGLTSLAINPDAPLILYAGSGGGVYKSIDGGSSWDFTIEGLLNSQVVALAIDPDAPQTVYAGTYSGGVYKTTNGADNWYPASTGMSSTYVRALAIDPLDSQTLYVGTWGGGVFKTTNGGNNWSEINSGLEKLGDYIYVYSLAIDPLDSQIIYAGTGLGIFQSTDGGSSWSEIGYGLLADAEIDALAIDPTEPQTLYAGTNGEGLWAYSVPPGGSYFTLAANAGGASTVITPGSAQLVNVGYAALEVDSGANPYGTAVFKFKQKVGAGSPEIQEVTVSEAGVPSSVPTTSARLFIDFRSNIPAVPGRPGAGNVDVNTGIAIVNPASVAATVTFTLRDRNGSILKFGNGTVEAGHHHSTFINQLSEIAPDFVLPEDFAETTQFGTLDIASDQALSVTALRGTINQRGEFLLTTTPVADLTQPLNSDSTYFPQFVDGGGYTTSLILLNTSDDTETGTFRIVDNDGQPLVVTQAGGGSGSEFDYAIPPHGAYHFQTDGSPESDKVGWVQLIPDAGSSAPVGSGVFAYNPVDMLLTESGIPSAASTTHARIFVDLSGSYNTGLAVANVMNSNANIELAFYLMDGSTPVGAGVEPVALKANGHTSQFANQLVEGLPEGFRGVLDISSETPFTALTVRTLFNERNDFLVTVFPIADANRAAPSPSLFPQIADGGGYTTQFILISPAGEMSATLFLYSPKGYPLDLENP